MTLLGIEPLLVLELAACSAVGAGFLAGLLGIGGGMVMVPFLNLILAQRGVSADLAVKMAIATAMATILFTSLSTMRAHHRRGAVRWDIVRGLAPGIALGGLAAGAGVFALVKGQALALVLRRSSWPTRRPRCCAPRRPNRRASCPAVRARQPSAGASVSSSGLVGAGGAFIAVPFMTRCNVPIHNAVATGAAIGFPDRAGQHAGLCHRRLVAAARAAGRAGLSIPAGAGADCAGQRLDRATGSARGACARRAPVAAHLRDDALRPRRRHAAARACSTGSIGS